MPFAVYVLGLAVFAQGTSEFMLSGLLSDIAADLHVSVPTAGLSTSAFAIGMVIGAPAMALLSRDRPRRRALLLFLGVFVAVHVVGALTPNYPILLATRVVGALANAGFWAVALVTAIDLAGPERRARATSVVVGGVTLACVVGVPAGALLGTWWGWRAAFWAVALVSLPALFAIARTVPERATGPEKAGTAGDTTDPEGAAGADGLGDAVGARRELRALATPSLLLTLVLSALVQGATFGSFAYLEPVVTEVTGLGDGWVPVTLALFGVGSFVGVTIAGRIVDARPNTLITVGAAALALGWAVLALTADRPAALIALVPIQGMLAFGTGTALITRVLRLAPAGSALAGAAATAAFNVGAALGPWLGGLAIDADLGYRAPLWVSTALMLAAVTVATVTLRCTKAPEISQAHQHT
ncbi:Cmx/CmrA family chloramphenicol efflux MFS transporter [Embleya scabrispora]|uniref:Cmx/CmrA family chloramphenicol efflux MFS transporter n=1 Tax=Embleya scabrispora TaxID=159449 RepID=UPI0003690B59|nr:Cmx/CmrA family chloramphenicol efflux MFS transporter [Embleya scabrispora]MYS78870.1 Cmx/CmrA family chloramphenicol efflux MFS transporter [Streptomyces sp. SID5474]